MGRISKYPITMCYKRRSFSETLSLPYSIQPLENESLYSYLIRTALAFGLSPGSFFNSFLKELGWHIGEKDIDLVVNEVQLIMLSKKLRLNYDTLYRMSLRSLSGVLFEKPVIKTSTPLVDAIKEKGTYFNGFAYKVCPLCYREFLNEVQNSKKILFKTGGLKKFWRLSFYLLCEKHEVFLLDRCPECGTPINFHKPHSEKLFGFCYKCGLNYADFPEIRVNNFTETLSTFKTLYQMLNGKFEWKNIKTFKSIAKKFEISSSLEFFSLLRNFIRISQRLLRICGYQVFELFNLNSLEVLKRFLDTFCLSESYLKEVLLKKKKFEMLSLEAKFVILNLTFKILNDYDEFINLVNHQRLKVSKGFLFKDWTGKSIFF